MKVSTALEQNIAVFGEAGSGKTVLLSSFYGPTQEREFEKTSPYAVVAENLGQHTRMYRNYLGMRDEGRPPVGDRFAGHSYAFDIKPRSNGPDKSLAKTGLNSLKLVWHDYPGEWFESDVSGPEESQRRIDTFRSLMSSDVALLLVDAKKLVDNAGDEQRYLKSLFKNFRNGIRLLKDDILTNGQPLVQFPRIWVIALSKADLLPDMSAHDLRDLVTLKASDELEQFRELIEELIEGDTALSVGEDFVTLSSARFTPEKIELMDRIGVDLLLPLASMLPLERHLRWAEASAHPLPQKVAENLLKGAKPWVNVLVNLPIPKKGPVGIVLNGIRALISPEIIDSFFDVADSQLKKLQEAALAKHEYLRAMLTGFQQDLERGEAEDTLLRSNR
ncbi:ATP/GTP-binding protein [Microbacterium sp. 3J1]|uniref:ATP/GTP-binding protein n=1 Tax=Microbacterium sp. 3J1 TaxID=861269 RepID=UPI000AFA770C|nr:ATP/GTP-binding protein [Microbacterium sp. 3J1]